MNAKNIFTELKRRNVYRAAVAYGVVAWFLTQLTTQVFPFFEIPNSAVRFVVIALTIGFPIAMLLAWVYEFTPEGVVRTEDLHPAQARSAQRVTGRILDFIIIGALLLVIAMLVVGRLPFYKQTGESISHKSIAVLPFENLSEDKANAYFATGIQDEILTRLAKIGALKVISRNSTQQYAARPGNLSEIAQQLAVANIVEGSVQKAGNQVHINVQLIRAATGEHLWADSYDRNLENIFGVEAEVAISVAEALKAKLSGVEHKVLAQRPTNNPEAYDAYLRGIALSGEQNFFSRLKAAKPLEEAVRFDPNFVLAWALLARVNSLAYETNATPGQRAAAQKALETALRLQPELPEVQMAQAFYQYRVLVDYDGARRSFEQLRPKLPNSAEIPEALGIIARRQGRWDESLVHTNEAIALNPRDPFLRRTVARVQRATRDFSAALRSYDEALSVWPDDVNLIDGKAEVYQALGQLDQADALLEKLRPTTENPAGINPIWHQAVLRRRPADVILIFENWLEQARSLPPLIRNYYSLALGDLQRLSGNVAAARITYSQARDDLEQSLKEQPPNEAAICAWLALAYAGLDDRERALAFIERAINLEVASKEVAEASVYEEGRARIAARFGMKDLAIPALEHLLKIPYFDSLTPALLRLDPDFDPLRGDPAFQKLCEEKQP